MKLKELVEQYGEYTVPQELIEKLEKPKPQSVWELEEGDEYYYINADGYINISTYAEVESEENCVSVGNVFLIYEEAEKDVERRKVETLLLKHGGRRWFKEDTPNYFIRVYENGGWLKSDWTNHSPIQGTIYFDTEKQAIDAIEEIGEDKIIEALFEVR